MDHPLSAGLGYVTGESYCHEEQRLLREMCNPAHVINEARTQLILPLGTSEEFAFVLGTCRPYFAPCHLATRRISATGDVSNTPAPSSTAMIIGSPITTVLNQYAFR